MTARDLMVIVDDPAVWALPTAQRVAGMARERSPLLVRPAIHDDEWWTAFVARVLSANGWPPAGRYHMRAMWPFVSELVTPTTRLEHCADRGVGTTAAVFAGTRVPRWALNPNAASFALCPACVAESPYVRLAWRVNMVTCCVKHGLLLHQRCPECAVPFETWRMTSGRCACGRALSATRGSDQAASEDELRLALSVDAAIAAGRVAASKVLSNGAGKVNVAEEREVFATGLFVTHLLSRLVLVGSRGAPQELTRMAGFVSSCYPDLQWRRDSVSELLRRLPSRACVNEAFRTVCRVHQRESLFPTVLRDLPFVEWARTLVQAGASVSAPERDRLVDREKSCVLCTVSEAAAMGATTVPRIASLIRRGVVTPAITFRFGPHQHLLSKEQIDSIARIRTWGYGCGAQTLLGLQGSALRTLRRLSAPTMWRDVVGRMVMDAGPLRTLLQALDQKALPAQEAPRPRTNLSSRAFWQARYEPAIAAVLEMLAQGQLAVFRSVAGAGFAGYCFGPEVVYQLEKLSRAWHAPPDESQWPLFDEPLAPAQGALKRRTFYWKPLTMRRLHPARPIQLAFDFC